MGATGHEARTGAPNAGGDNSSPVCCKVCTIFFLWVLFCFGSPQSSRLKGADGSSVTACTGPAGLGCHRAELRVVPFPAGNKVGIWEWDESFCQMFPDEERHQETGCDEMKG